VDNALTWAPHAASGRVRALGVTSRRRSPLLPEVPTLDESGLPGFEATSWFGVQAPARLPRPIVAQIGAAIDAGTKDPAYRARLVELGADPPNLTPDGGTTPEAFTEFVRAEIAKWAEVVRISGAKVD
jgi:tripartite-type tricarboxylate transporter receptor subunit TctC